MHYYDHVKGSTACDTNGMHGESQSRTPRVKGASPQVAEDLSRTPVYSSTGSPVASSMHAHLRNIA